MGHGSMVASVAGTPHGVAPGVMLGSYRVFGCSGYAGDNVLVEAIDRAVRDGCDIINLSLASGSGYEDNDMYQRVMANAIAKGVLVVKAAGNSGTEGPFRADVSTAVGAITVASVDVITKHGGRVSMSPFSSFGPVSWGRGAAGCQVQLLRALPHLSIPLHSPLSLLLLLPKHRTPTWTCCRTCRRRAVTCRSWTRTVSLTPPQGRHFHHPTPRACSRCGCSRSSRPRQTRACRWTGAPSATTRRCVAWW
jgi:hypothetical protein